jgi:hypothetical protein
VVRISGRVRCEAIEHRCLSGQGGGAGAGLAADFGGPAPGLCIPSALSCMHAPQCNRSPSAGIANTVDVVIFDVSIVFLMTAPSNNTPLPCDARIDIMQLVFRWLVHDRAYARNLEICHTCLCRALKV